MVEVADAVTRGDAGELRTFCLEAGDRRPRLTSLLDVEGAADRDAELKQAEHRVVDA